MTAPSDFPPPPTDLAIRVSTLAGVTLAGFMALGLVATGALMVSGKVEWLPPQTTTDTLLHGNVTHAFAKQLSGTFLAQRMADLERGASWLVLRDTGPRVRQGCPGWLFLADEFKLNRNAQSNADTKAQAVIDLQRTLGLRGIKLLVAVVPDKSRIAASALCALYRPAVLQERVLAWTAKLNAAGVTAVDLTASLQPLGADAYLRTDTHWSESGADAAARTVAFQVRQMGISATPARSFETQTGPQALRPGDLVRLAGLEWLPLSLQPPAQYVAAAQVVEQVVEPAGTASADADSLDDLFGDSNLPNVALIGTSFSRNSGFVGFLQRALGAPLGNFAKDGGEFSGAAVAYFDNPAFKQTPPGLLIWEIPERDLQTPYKDVIKVGR